MGRSLRVRHISVKRLFGLFDHSVPLNLAEHLTIIHGGNGLGKTALLRLLNGFFSSRFFELNEFPFSNFQIDFDNGSRLVINRKPRTSGEEGALIFVYSPERGTDLRHTFYPDRPGKLRAGRRYAPSHFEFLIPELVPELEQIGPNRYHSMETGEVFSAYEVLARFEEHFPESLRRELGLEKEPDWFTELRNSLDVHFIQAQRLLAFNQQRPSASRPAGPTFTPAVQVYSEEITRAIKNTLTEYAELSQSLDRTFPQRLVRQNWEQNLSGTDLQMRLRALEHKRQALQTAGLLEEEAGVGFEMPQPLERTTQNVLSVYVQDVEKKLGVFDTLANKIDLLKQIVDKRFLYKRMIVNRDRGFLFTNEDGGSLSPTQLSSGEQNQLVLFFELLFRVKQKSLILIDEPEISLHIAWQLEFLKDLQEVIQLSRFDVLIATHSPQIINDRWDLTVQLRGRRERKK